METVPPPGKPESNYWVNPPQKWQREKEKREIRVRSKTRGNGKGERGRERVEKMRKLKRGARDLLRKKDERKTEKQRESPKPSARKRQSP